VRAAVQAASSAQINWSKSAVATCRARRRTNTWRFQVFGFLFWWDLPTSEIDQTTARRLTSWGPAHLVVLAGAVTPLAGLALHPGLESPPQRLQHRVAALPPRRHRPHACRVSAENHTRAFPNPEPVSQPLQQRGAALPPPLDRPPVCRYDLGGGHDSGQTCRP